MNFSEKIFCSKNQPPHQTDNQKIISVNTTRCLLDLFRNTVNHLNSAKFIATIQNFMSLKFSKLSKSPKNFLHLTGVKIEEFRELVERMKPDWQLIKETKKCEGRTSQLSTIEDQILCRLLYYLTYNSQEFLGFLFDLRESNICRLIEPIASNIILPIKKKKNQPLTKEEKLYNKTLS